MSQRWKLVLVAALFVGLVLRVWGIGFGLPHRYHIDEPYYVLGALKLANGEFHLTIPHNTPNIWQFLLLGEYGILFILGWIAKVFSQPGDMATLYLTDPSVFYILGRLSSVVAGVGTIGLTYLLGKEARDRQTGAIAAILLAFTFLHARDSHYAVNDALIALLTTFACYASLVYLRTGSRGILLLGFAACGAAIGMKYRPVAFLLPLLLVVLWRARQEGAAKLGRTGIMTLLAMGALSLGFVIGFPGVIINTQVFLDQFRAALAQAGVSYEGWIVDPAPPWLYYLRILAVGMGLPVLVAAAIGMGLSLRLRDRKAVLLIVTAGAYFVLISLFKTYFARYALPLLPLLTLFAAYAIRSALTWVGHWRPAWILPAAAALLLGCVVIPLAYLVRHDYLLTQTDTRTQAKAWIEANLPEGSNIATDWRVHGPPLSMHDDPEPGSRVVYEVTIVGGKGLSDHPVQFYRENGVEYLVTTSFIADIAVVDPEQEAGRQAFYASLDQELELVREFRPAGGDGEPWFVFDEIYTPLVSLWQRERPGPTIKIYRLGP